MIIETEEEGRRRRNPNKNGKREWACGDLTVSGSKKNAGSREKLGGGIEANHAEDEVGNVQCGGVRKGKRGKERSLSILGGYFGLW